MTDDNTLDPWLLSHLACPVDKLPLSLAGEELACSQGHKYQVAHGVPVLLAPDAPATHPAIHQTLDEVAGTRPMQSHSTEPVAEIDPVVQIIVAATSGYLYRPLLGKLKRYPIPELRLPAGGGKHLLDIGCNWGRWSVAASQKGYRAIGMDPDLGAIFAARRVAKSLSVSPNFVVGDARALPFSNDAFDVVFSFGVLQHLSKPDVRQALAEVSRVMTPGGKSLIQMPNAFGVRSLYHLLRRGRTEAKEFDVRYWTPRELKSTFRKLIGPSELSVDGFGGLGIQAADRDLLPRSYRMIVDASEMLRKVSRKLPFVGTVADSLYIESRR